MALQRAGAGRGAGRAGGLEMALLAEVPRALLWRFPPTRPGLAEAGSSPRTQRAHVCKYSLKWKPRDGSWTFFPD